MRLRQVALAARDLEKTVGDLCAVFDLEVAFRDPGVAAFGLVNAVLPVGVLRAVERPCYEALLDQQIHDATEARGAGDLRKLLHGSDTWTVGG